MDISASKGDIEILVDISLHLVVFLVPLHWWSHTRILGGAYCFQIWLIFHIFSSTKNAYLLMQTFFTEHHSRITFCCSGRLNYLSKVPGNVLFVIYDHFGPIYDIFKISRFLKEKFLIRQNEIPMSPSGL